MLALAVLPFLDRQLAAESLASLTDPRILPLPWDNSQRNLGVARPWRRAAELVLDGAADWLILWSTAIVLGPDGGSLLADELERPEPNRLRPDVPLMVSGLGCGWHLHAIPRQALELVGVFDDAAFFSYYEDSDWLYRYELAGLGNLWEDGNVQAKVQPAVNRGDAHSLRAGLAQVDYAAAGAAYERKWGGPPQHERYSSPYGRPELSWAYVGEPA